MNIIDMLYTINQTKPYNKDIVLKQPVVERKEKNVDYDRISKMPFAKEIIEFINLIIQTFDDEDLTNFYNNINTFKIELNKKCNIYDNCYDVINNTIYINEANVKSTIYHELFHLASSTKKGDNNFVGFSQCNKNKFIRFGDAITEGYTQLLKERYFGLDDENYKHAYVSEVTFALFLEPIVGTKKMTKLFLNSDLNGLIKELEKYSNINEIMQFLSATDFLNQYKFFSKNQLENMFLQPLIIKSLKSIKKFLIKTYTNKCLNEIKKQKDAESKQKIVDILNIYINEVLKNGTVVNPINKKEVQIISNVTIEKDLRRVIRMSMKR